MIVYVVIRGEYSGAHVDSVYASLEAAKAAYPREWKEWGDCWTFGGANELREDNRELWDPLQIEPYELKGDGESELLERIAEQRNG